MKMKNKKAEEQAKFEQRRAERREMKRRKRQSENLERIEPEKEEQKIIFKKRFYILKHFFIYCEKIIW